MTATLKLPRILSSAIDIGVSHDVAWASVAAALEDLFARQPGLRHHLFDEQGNIRPHVAVFVDGIQAELVTPVGEHSEIRILHAVSGGSPNSRFRDFRL